MEASAELTRAKAAVRAQCEASAFWSGPWVAARRVEDDAEEKEAMAAEERRTATEEWRRGSDRKVEAEVERNAVTFRGSRLTLERGEEGVEQRRSEGGRTYRPTDKEYRQLREGLVTREEKEMIEYETYAERYRGVLDRSADDGVRDVACADDKSPGETWMAEAVT